MSDCIFCKIIKGDIPSSLVYEDDISYVFLDINPVQNYHTLVIPKTHVASFHELPKEQIGSFFATVQRVANVIHKITGYDYNILSNNGPASGQVVFHLHFHIIPATEEHNVKNTRVLPQEKRLDFEDVLANIKKELQ